MKTFVTSTIIISIFVTILIGVPALAQSNTPGDDIVQLTNPIGSTNIQALVGKAISTALTILGSLALAVFVYGGFLWLTSAGNEERIKNGTTTMVWAAAGILLIFGSYTIINFIFQGITKTEPTTSFTPDNSSGGELGCYCSVVDGKSLLEPQLVPALAPKSTCVTYADFDPDYAGTDPLESNYGNCIWYGP